MRRITITKIATLTIHSERQSSGGSINSCRQSVSRGLAPAKAIAILLVTICDQIDAPGRWCEPATKKNQFEVNPIIGPSDLSD